MAKEKRTPVLHEILAVVGDLKGAKDKIKNATFRTFSDKPNLFSGMRSHLRMFAEDRKEEETTDITVVSTTVMDELGNMTKAFIRFWDAKLQKESAGQLAKADVVIGENVIASDIPVYFLLEMETELKELRKVYDAIPTLKPGPSWIQDTQQRDGIWKTESPVVRHKTEKTYEHKVLVPSTKEHPAQIREWTEDKPIGQKIQDEWSGMMTSAEKSLILDRFDTLLRAFKKARQRANSQELPEGSIGSSIFSYLHTTK